MSINAISMLKEAGYNLRILDTSTVFFENNWLYDQLDDVIALVVGHNIIDETIMARATNLKLIAKQGTGVDNIDINAASEKGILVVSAGGANADSVADLTFGLMLAVARRIVFAHNLIADGGWERVFGNEIYKKKLGIIGFGEIGQKVAQRARGFLMETAYSDIIAYSQAEQRLGIKRIDLDTLLSWSDFVTVHIPLNDSTRHLIGKRELTIMKPSSYLINLSRGGVVDEKALYWALSENQIAGAGLDVFESEPISDLNIAQLPNIVVSPHMGAYTFEALERVSSLVAKTILTGLSGEIPQTAINPEAFQESSTK
jgi:D-3-phosphoglycerate dehydrogenase